MSGHYTLTTAGRFFKKCQNFCQKIASGAYFRRQNVAPWWCNENFFSETNFICMDFICLQWLAAGILFGRNNGLLRCYVGFCIRAKTGFSYMILGSKLVFRRKSDLLRFWCIISPWVKIRKGWLLHQIKTYKCTLVWDKKNFDVHTQGTFLDNLRNLQFSLKSTKFRWPNKGVSKIVSAYIRHKKKYENKLHAYI